MEHYTNGEAALAEESIPARSRGPAGTMIHTGRHGTQIVSTRGHRWSDAAEELFLDHLAATANVGASARACGFSSEAIYRRRRTDPVFEQRWDAALAQGYVPRELADDTGNGRFEIEIIGDQRKATIITEPLFDPSGSKMRS